MIDEKNRESEGNVDPSETGKTELIGGRDTDLKGMIGKDLIKGQVGEKHRRNFSELSFANMGHSQDDSNVQLISQQ